MTKLRVIQSRYDTTSNGAPNRCWKNNGGCGERVRKGDSISPNPAGSGWLHTKCARTILVGGDPSEGKSTKPKKKNKPEKKSETPPQSNKLAVVNICGKGVLLPNKWQDIKLSEPQQAVCSSFIQDKQNLQVIAGPGCGKSFTTKILAWVAKSLGYSGLYLAFNNVTVNEMNESGDLPPGFSCSTTHSEGKRTISRALGRVKVKLDKSKLKRILKGVWDVSRYVPRDIKAQRWSNVRLAQQLVPLYKSQLLSTPEDGRLLMQRFNIHPNAANVREVLGQIPNILETCKTEIEAGTIDFDDMLWGPVVLGWKPRARKVVFVDEAQDFTPCQLRFALSIAGNKGRTVMVGDPRQAIYGWRGAANNGMDTALSALKAHDRGANRLPLLLTYRCSKSSTALCNLLFHSGEKLSAIKSNHDGHLMMVQSGTDWLSKLDRKRLIITSRCNAPLVSKALKLLKDGQKAVIRGRDFHKGIIAEIKRHNPYENDSMVVFLSALSGYIATEKRKLAEKGEELPQSIQDQHECILALSDGLKSVKAMLQKIEDIFSETNTDGAYILSTIHQVKGLETDWIAIIGGRMPGPWAETEEQIREETNIQWVAYSRAKYGLVFEDQGPNVGLPSGYTWSKLEDAIASDPHKPVDSPKGPKGGKNRKKVKAAHSEPEAKPQTDTSSNTSPRLTLQISTTLDVRSGNNRGKGVNAIDIVALGMTGKPCMDSPARTYRRQGWQYHLVRKANACINKRCNGYTLPKPPSNKRTRDYVDVTLEDWQAIAEQYNAINGISTRFSTPKGWLQRALFIEVL